jgi:hypothetical protein
MNEQRTNGGIIFKNDRKQNDKARTTGKNQRGWCGKGDFALGERGRKGKFFSVQISEPYVKPTSPQRTTRRRPTMTCHFSVNQ